MNDPRAATTHGLEGHLMSNPTGGGDPRDPSSTPQSPSDQVPPDSAPDPNPSPGEPTQKVSAAELLGESGNRPAGSEETTEPVPSTPDTRSPDTSTPLTSTPGAGPEGTSVPQSHSPADGVTRVISTGGASTGSAPQGHTAPPAPPGPPPSGYDSTRVISTRPPGGPGGPGEPPQPGYGPPPGYGRQGPGQQGPGQQGHRQPAPPGYGPQGTPPGYGGAYGQPGPPAPGGRPGYGPSPQQQAPAGSPPGQHAFGDDPRPGLTPKTNTLAVAALVASLLGLVCVGIGGLVGLVLGVVARRQIAASGGGQTGDGLALTAIVIGLFIVVMWAAYWLVVVFTGVESPWSYI